MVERQEIITECFEKLMLRLKEVQEIIINSHDQNHDPSLCVAEGFRNFRQSSTNQIRLINMGLKMSNWPRIKNSKVNKLTAELS